VGDGSCDGDRIDIISPAGRRPPAVTAPSAAAFPVPLILLTDRHQAVRPWLATVAAAVAGGVRLVIVREKDLTLERRRELAEQLRELLVPLRGTVLLAGPRPGPGGQHLGTTDPWPRHRQG
jgi:hypothetical protein